MKTIEPLQSDATTDMIIKTVNLLIEDREQTEQKHENSDRENVKQRDVETVKSLGR